MSVRTDRNVLRSAVGALSVLAAAIAIFTFVTGWVSIRDVVTAMREKAASLKKPVDNYDFGSPALVAGLDAQSFEIKIGEIRNDFAFSPIGYVLYRGEHFSPAVRFTPGDTPAILVSAPAALRYATIVGLDRDGQRSLFVVNLNDLHSIFAKQPARDVYWSPDRRHVVTLNAYEAQWFASIDVLTGAVVDGPTLGSKNGQWYVEGKIRWAPDGHTFLAKVVETVNVYEGGDVNKGPLNTFPIRVDVPKLTMKAAPTKRSAGGA